MTGYSYLYLVVDVFRDDVKLEPGDLLAWDNHGMYYTITTFDRVTREIRPLANVYLVKRLSREERECLGRDGARPCECIPGFEERLRERVLDAAKVFKLDGKHLDELYNNALKAGGCEVVG